MKKIDLKKIYDIRSKYLNKETMIENKWLILKVLICFIAFILIIFTIFDDSDKEIEKELRENSVASDEEEIDEKDYIIVDVSGAVNNPMVIQLPSESRVEDAITAAGGLREDADINSINRAEILTDGTKIFIPSKNEAASSTDKNEYIVKGEQGKNKKVNINTADSEELKTINGIGPATAEKIIFYRNENGRFKNIEDLKKIDGIGEKTFEKIKDHVYV